MTSVRCSNWVIRMNNDSRHQTRFQDVAYILHSRAYQNTSLIADVFTREHGRIGLVAKGVKRPASKMFGVIQPWQRLFVSWGGRSELKTLYSAEIEPRNTTALTGERIYLGLYINELLLRLLHLDEAHAQIFDYYQACLRELASVADTEPSLRYFEIQLLEELGYGVNFLYDYQTEAHIQPDSVYAFVPDRGFILREYHHEDALLIHGQTIISLSNRQLDTVEQKKEAKILLRSIIEHHLEGRPLKSRELFQQKRGSLQH